MNLIKIAQAGLPYRLSWYLASLSCGLVSLLELHKLLSRFHAIDDDSMQTDGFHIAPDELLKWPAFS